MKRIILILLLFQVGLIGVYGQKSVQGVVVTESKKGKLTPVPFANVYWHGTNYGTSTDSLGSFNLAIPEEKSYIIISSLGFTSDTILKVNENMIETVILKPSTNQLSTVNVEYRRKSTEMSFINPITTINMNEKELFKAACCNLSESFETNPSVDVNFTDAVTGTKQIRMLGLNGPYTLISRENMAGIRGLGNAFGISFIPGTWINSIQVTKGVGSVVNGYESIAGQINFELQKPELGEQTFLNLFANAGGRIEANVVHTEQFSEKLGTTLLLHQNSRSFERDVNDDGFRDFPLQKQTNLMNRWKYDSQKGIMGQIGIHYVNDQKEGGQTDKQVENQLGSPYRIDIDSESLELFGKVGYVFTDFKYKSMGFLWSLKNHEQNSNYGLRNYDVQHRSLNANYIYQSIIENTNHQFKTGASFVLDEYLESFENSNFDRVERISGAFFEYTYKPTNNFTLVSGIRGDYHNFYDFFVSPRIHLRYQLNETTVLRSLAGSGQRSPTVLIDRQSLMASSRDFNFLSSGEGAYGLEMEKAWNFGANLSKAFTLDFREGNIQVDVYRTTFENQAVVDVDNSADEVLIYNLDGKSFSNTAQFQIDYELIKFLDVRLAYRWVQVKTDYTKGLLQQAFTPENRFFINVGYETAKSVTEANWAFDFTIQQFGKQRIPTTEGNAENNLRSNESPSFALLGGQVTRNFSKKLAIYAGVDNLLDFRQENPIISSENPFGNDFDASMVWGPVFGRNIYAGLRWRIQKEED